MKIKPSHHRINKQGQSGKENINLTAAGIENEAGKKLNIIILATLLSISPVILEQ